MARREGRTVQPVITLLRTLLDVLGALVTLGQFAGMVALSWLPDAASQCWSEESRP